MVLLLSILGAAFSLGGNILIIFKKKSGWLAWIIGNILWIIVNFISIFNLPMVLMYLAYMGINISGFIRWAKKEKSGQQS